ncbi:MAG: redox-regulated ATPase YchF [Patescibacteria group bacterium]
MSLSVGIVGLPNAGKSTLFEAITKKQVNRENYPFCTIEPNIGVIAVPDERLEALNSLFNSKKKVHTTIEFVDIAGLVRGASEGKGLGNKFLANIRETDAVVYVLRGFNDPDVVHVEGRIDILSDKEILDTEMALKDMETVEKRLFALEKEARTRDKEAIKEVGIVKKAFELLKEGKMLFDFGWNDEERDILKSYQLLTLKPRLYFINGKDEDIDSKIIEEFKKNNWNFLIIDVMTELEAGQLNKEERLDLGFPEELEFNNFVQSSYSLLDLITFFTIGEDETRAWTIKKGSFAPQAGGAIHSDFEEKFIKADVIFWKDLVEAGSLSKAKEKGKLRTEGKEYLVQDGDVIEIKSNA